MRYVSAAFTTHLQGTTLFLAVCLKITPRAGSVRYFTDWSSDLVVGGQTYRSSIGVKYYRLEDNAGFDTGQWAIEGLISGSSFSLRELESQVGYLGSATVELFAVNPNDLTMGTWPLKYGRLLRVVPKGEGFSLECETLDALLSRTPLVQTYSLDCRWQFGDANCGVTPASYPGEATALTEFTVTDAAFGGPGTAGYFHYGKFIFDDLPEFVNRVKSYDSGTKTFTLFLPIPILAGVPAVGSTFTVEQGCDKRYLSCRDTHANVENFGGFPFIPDKKKTKLNFPILSGLVGGGT